MIFLLGNLASRWHANGTSKWLVNWWELRQDMVQNDKISLGDIAPEKVVGGGGGVQVSKGGVHVSPPKKNCVCPEVTRLSCPESLSDEHCGTLQSFE